MSMEKIVEQACEELDRRAERLKDELGQQRDLGEALRVLDEAKEALKENIRGLAELNLPEDLIKWYLETGGRMFTTKTIYYERDEHYTRLFVNHVDHYLLRDGDHGGNILLPTGFYRFVLMAVPQEVSLNEEERRRGEWQDEYGRRVRIREKAGG